MKIKEIFSTRIQEKIDPVVKVADLENDTKIADELGSYVVTPSIEKFLDRYLEHYTDTFYQNTEEIGAWVSGYFGSGKSYLAKIIALLAENREVNGLPAAEIFDPRLDKTTPYGSGISRHLSRMKSVHTDIYAFNINTLADSTHSHLAPLLLSYYYHGKGYSSNIYYAHVIERELEKTGRIEELHNKIEEISGRSWNQIRTNPTFYQNSFYEAACEIAPEAFTCVDDVKSSLEAAIEGQAINVQTLIETLLEDLKNQEEKIGKKTRLMFVLDEMGQWIGDNSDKLYQLQALAEEAAIRGKGRIWIVVTTHEDMGTIIETAIRLRPDTKKIESRFQHRMSLTTENIELVLQDRLLKKNIQGRNELEKLYNINSGMLRGLGQLVDSTQILPECTLENFVTFYPFLPYHIHIIPDIVKSLRSQGGRGEQLSGSTRTLLAITQDIIRTGRRDYLELSVGDLVTFDEVFENLASDGEINPEIRKDVKDIEREVPQATLFTRKVAEVLFLVRDLPYIRKSSDNISRLLIEDIEQDLTRLKPQIESELKTLTDAEMVSKAGTEYEFLTGERRSFEKEVRAVKNQMKHQDRQKGVAQFAQQAIGFKTIKYMNTEFDVKTYFDDTSVNSKGYIEIRFYSPYAALSGMNITDLEERSLRQENHHTIYILSSKVPNFDQELNYYLAMKEVIQSWKGDPNKTQYERQLATDREKKELEKIKTNLLGMINEGLNNCHIIHRGPSRALVNGDPKASTMIRDEVAKFWPSLYEKFKKVPVRLSNERADIVDVLVGNTRLSNEVKSLKIFDSNGQVNINTPLLDELRIFLATQETRQMRTTGDDLLKKYSEPPYGWDSGVVRVGIAALLRNGNLRVSINKKSYENPKDAVLQDAIRNINQFKKIEIELEQVDIPLDKLIKVRELLIKVTGDKKIEETVSGITQAFEILGNKILDKSNIVKIWATPAEFPIPDKFTDTEEKINEILELPNNARTVDELFNNLELLEEGIKTIEDISEYQEKWGSAYLDVKNHYYDVKRVEHKLDQESPSRQFIDNYLASRNSKNIADVENWKDLQRSKQESELHTKTLIKQWKTDAETIIDNAIKNLPELLTENKIDLDKQEQLEKPLREFKTTLNDVNSLLSASTLPERALSYVETMQHEIRKLIKKEPPQPPTKRVERISITNITLGRRIVDENEWETMKNRLDAKVKAALNEGKDVIVE